MKLSDILKTSCESFSVKFLEVNNFLINYLQYFAKEVELNFMKVFLSTKEKDSMQSLKQNLTQFTWNTLLYCLCNNKAKIWACCCCKAWIAWLCWAWICWFCIMSWLCCHSRASLSLFCSCKSSDLSLRSLFKFFSKKTNHFLTKPSTLISSPVSLSLASYVFISLEIFPFIFFLFLELSYFRFRYHAVFFKYLLQFYVYFLQFSLLGLQEVATFDFSSCFWLVPVHEGSKMISETSRRYCKFFAVV